MEQQHIQEVSKISYGNPNQNDFKLLNEKNFLDIILSETENLAPYDNDSNEVKLELHQIIQSINSIRNQEEILQRYKLYDSHLLEYIEETLSIELPNQSAVISETIKSIITDIQPLLIKLKYKYQRPRPYQLGYHFKMSLYPYSSVTSDTPSYPSGHAFQSKIICEVLGNIYPLYYKQLFDLAEDISYSRLFLGVHYKSDIDAAFMFADKVLRNKEFQNKYRI